MPNAKYLSHVKNYKWLLLEIRIIEKYMISNTFESLTFSMLINTFSIPSMPYNEIFKFHIHL